jgi:hypothetical protein
MKIRTTALLWILAIAMLFGCGPRAGSLVPPRDFGLTDDIEALADRFEAFDVHASSDLGTTTALVFDMRDDGWTVRPRGSFWIRVDTRQELMARIGEMRWAYGETNRLRAIRAPEDQGAAGLVYSPSLVGTRIDGREVVVSGVSLRDACTGATVYFGHSPCMELWERR